MSALSTTIARALRALDARQTSEGDAISFHVDAPARRGVYAGSAGLVYARLSLDPNMASATRAGLIRGLARGLEEREPEPDYLDGVGSELDLLTRLAPKTVRLTEIARALLPRLEARLAREGGPHDPGLHGGLAGRLATLACVACVARVAPKAELVADLAKRLGRAFVLTPRGLGLASLGARRPLVGLTHGAGGVAWAIERLSSEGHLSRRLAECLRTYVRFREEGLLHGWPDDRDDEGPTRFTTSYCHGSFGHLVSAARGRDGNAVRQRALAHLLAEAARGGNGSLSLCHGDPSTLSALRADPQTAPQARRLTEALEARLHGAGFDDVGRGLFTSAIGALVALVGRGSPGRVPPIPWLPSSHLLRPLGAPLEELVPAALEASMPSAGPRLRAHERAQILDALALGTLVRAPRAACPPRVADFLELDVEPTRFHWSFADDAAVARLGSKERTKGRAVAGALGALTNATPLACSSRVAVRSTHERSHLLVHEGARVDVVEVDTALCRVLAIAREGATLASLEEAIRQSARAPTDPRGAIGALLALGYLVVPDHSPEIPTWNMKNKAS